MPIGCQRQSKEVAGSLRYQGPLADLMSGRRNLHGVAIVSICGNEVPVGGHRQAQRALRKPPEVSVLLPSITGVVRDIAFGMAVMWLPGVSTT